MSKFKQKKAAIKTAYFAKKNELVRKHYGKSLSTKIPSPYKQICANPNGFTLGTLESGHLLFVDTIARTMHTHICGGTGKGKSTLLEHMIRQDIRNGAGVCVIDPHGGHEHNLYNNILRWLHDSKYHKSRTVHLIDPSSPEYVTGFNPLQMVEGVSLSVITDAALEAMEVAWGNENTQDKPRLRRVVTATFALLAEHGLTLAEARHLLNIEKGKELRQFLAHNLTEEYSRDVWEDLLAMKSDKFREYIEGPLNRLAEFVRSEAIGRMIGQTDNVIDFREAMDNSDVVLVNLQGGDSSSGKSVRAASGKATELLGTLIVRDLFEQCSRRKRPDRPFYLYIDECHKYLSGDIPSILDEARKFGLHVILAHQRLAQLTEAGPAIYNAVLGSTEIKVVMGGLAIDEAKIMAEDIIALDLEKPVAALISPTIVGYETIELLNTSQSSSEGYNESFTDGETTTETESTGKGGGTVESGGISATVSDRPNLTDDEEYIERTEVHTAGEVYGEAASSSWSDTEGLSEARTTSKTTGLSSSSSKSAGRSQAREAILEQRASSVYGMDKLLYMAGTGLKNLKRGEAVVSIGDVAWKITTPHVQQRPMQQTLADFKRELYQKSSVAIPIERADQNIKERYNQLITAMKDFKISKRQKVREEEEKFGAWDEN